MIVIFQLFVSAAEMPLSLNACHRQFQGETETKTAGMCKAITVTGQIYFTWLIIQ